MTDDQQKENSLRAEFESLGRTLTDALRAAWETPESKRLREEVVDGLSGLGGTLQREVDNLANSEAAQQFRTGVGQAAEKLGSAEVQNKVRGELIGALQSLNSELQKLIDNWQAEPGTADKAAPEVIDIDPSAGVGDTNRTGTEDQGG